MERTDDEVLSEIQKIVSELNIAIGYATDKGIEIVIKQSKHLTMGTATPSSYITFEATKRLTPNYISYTGGY